MVIVKAVSAVGRGGRCGSGPGGGNGDLRQVLSGRQINVFIVGLMCVIPFRVACCVSVFTAMSGVHG